MRVGILVTHIRAEEKLLIEAFRQQGVEPDMILDRALNFDVTGDASQAAPNGTPWRDYDLIMERSVSTSRGTYALMLLNGCVDAWCEQLRRQMGFVCRMDLGM
ncbi:MAG: hypothetical protein AAFR56_17445, partial [Chloroflexota bacterium]